MNSIILYISSVESTLIREVLSELLVDVGRADSPRILAIDGISESGSVHDGETKLHTPLFDVHRLLFDGGRFLDTICNRNSLLCSKL